MNHRRAGCGAFVLFIALTSALSSPLAAQWPQFKGARVPRLPDGQVDLHAPAPRAADGKVDLSGLWENSGWRQLASVSVSGTGGAPGRGTLLPGPARFFNLGTAVEGGLPFQPWAAELRRKRMADNMKDNPDAHCLPLGNMQLHTHPEPRKIIQTSDLVVILYEGNAGMRQIFLDGRPLPSSTDVQPWWFGYSTGKWDGDTLVVQTTGFRDLGWLDVNGSPITEGAIVTERFRRPDVGTLDIEVTVDDKKAYTKPWTVTLAQQLMPDTELIEFVCAENEKSSEHF